MLLEKYWDNNLNEKSFAELTDRDSGWWICDNHEERYFKSVSSQKKNFGCKYCIGNSVLQGFNDLATTHPSVAKLWDYENNDLTPYEVKASTHKNYYFICDKKGHSFEQRLAYFIESGMSCPFCSGKRVLIGFNDLATTHPEIAQEVNVEESQYLPTEITSGSSKKVPFICNHGHHYISTPKNRVMQKNGCPYCSGKKTIVGKTDIFSVYPEYEKFWDYSKNTIKPEDVSRSSGKKYWWICDKGHSYDMSPNTKFGGKKIQNCPVCSGHRVQKDYNDLLTTNTTLCREWNYDRNTQDPSEYSRGSKEKVWWKRQKGHSFKSVIKERTRPRKNRNSPTGCPICNANFSFTEQEIADFVTSILSPDTVVMRNDRSCIYPKELDIYIPDKKIAIEFNGLYWHSETAGKDRRYHYDKWKQCNDQGVQLITIWEDDWLNKRSIVESMLAHKLGVHDGAAVYARKTVVEEIPFVIAKDFLDKYHIQGSVQGSIYFGLYYKDNLLAVSVWRKNKTQLYLDRYATSCNVVGGMGKMLKQGKLYAKQQGLLQIITFADHEVSNGNLYEVLGFDHDKELAPDYKYVVDGQRKHKFGYRLKRFKNDPALIYQDGLTELQLANLNNIYRVWDCGKSRYVMDI